MSPETQTKPAVIQLACDLVALRCTVARVSSLRAVRCSIAAFALAACAPAEKPFTPPAPDAPHILPEHCDKMIDHYIDLVVAGPSGEMQYWTPERRHETVRERVAADPNMQGLRRECIRTATGRQYSCAIEASTIAAWQSCVR